ncbi:unnamed protein product, partial [Effrenium voratum]
FHKSPDTNRSWFDVSMSANGQWLPMPAPSQTWAHSCCSKASLDSAFRRRDITAIEADILMGCISGEGSAPNAEGTPIMAHPPWRVSDLGFEEFWESCLSEGRHHLKLDFKDLRSLQLCLPKVAASKSRLAEKGQAVWINADILPGPNRRGEVCPIPATEFFAALKATCPGVPVSLGWRTARGFRDAYTAQDIAAMLDLCQGDVSGGTVFAISARLALRDPEPLLALLRLKPGSQLLLWTGAGEAPLPSWRFKRLMNAFRTSSA